MQIMLTHLPYPNTIDRDTEIHNILSSKDGSLYKLMMALNGEEDGHMNMMLAPDIPIEVSTILVSMSLPNPCVIF